MAIADASTLVFECNEHDVEQVTQIGTFYFEMRCQINLVEIQSRCLHINNDATQLPSNIPSTFLISNILLEHHHHPTLHSAALRTHHWHSTCSRFQCTSNSLKTMSKISNKPHQRQYLTQTAAQYTFHGTICQRHAKSSTSTQ